MALAVGVIAALVAGCSGGDDSTAGGSAGSMPTAGLSADRVPAPASAEGFSVSSRGEAADPVPASQLTSFDRQLARTASMTVRAEDAARAAAAARQIAADAGGYVGSERSDEESASLTLVVPSEEIDGVLADLAGLGKRIEQRVSVEDVTDQIVDVDSRVASQRESVERVRKLLARAESISDLVTIERELAWREAELESLLARQDALRGRVTMAPISLELVEKPGTNGDRDDGYSFLAGLAAGWGAFTTFLGATAEALGAALPFLVLAGVLAALALLARRRRRHARGGAPAGG